MTDLTPRLATSLAEATVALDLAETRARREPERTDYQRDVSASLDRLGDLYRALGDGQRAHDAHQRSLEIAEGLVRREPERAEYQSDVSFALERLGDLYHALGDGQRAHDAWQRSLGISEALARRMPEREDYRRDVAVDALSLAWFHFKRGQVEEALPYFRRNLLVMGALFDAEPQRADLAVDYADLLSNVPVWDPSEGHASLLKAKAILSRLDESGRLMPDDRHMLDRVNALLEQHPPP